MKLTWMDVLFSFSGRIPRKVFWCGFLISMAILFSGVFISAVLEGVFRPLSAALMFPTVIFFFWTQLALAVKRWHDRDKSGWWIFIGLIPYIGGLWAMVETGFLRGTCGENRFGSDLTDGY